MFPEKNIKPFFRVVKSILFREQFFLFRKVVPPMRQTDDFVMNTLLTGERTIAVGIDVAADTVDQPHRAGLTADKIFLRQTAGVAACTVCSQLFEQSAVARPLTVCP